MFHRALAACIRGRSTNDVPTYPGRRRSSPSRSTPHTPPHVDCPRTQGWPHGKHCFPRPCAGASTQVTGPCGARHESRVVRFLLLLLLKSVNWRQSSAATILGSSESSAYMPILVSWMSVAYTVKSIAPAPHLMPSFPGSA
jgi:hypothetical protein